MAGISDRVAGILLDIEGTTTPVDFVFGVLFPFARDRLASYLQTHGHGPEVQADLALLRQDYAADQAAGIEAPAWIEDSPTAAVPYLQFLIDRDRKSTGLKSLQGKIWNQGYAEGRLQSQLFADVPPALNRWHQAGKQIHIFSSGSIQAQKLLFGHTEYGDLTPLIQGYFDTTTGPKREADSYHRIAAAIGLAPDQILFISDVAAELSAAQTAGMATLFSCRPGNPHRDAAGFTLITDFTAL